MDVRIDSRLGSVKNTETQRADQTGAPLSGANRVDTRTGTGDQVEMSSISEAIATGTAALEAQQASRTRALSALYQSGAYNVDPVKVAKSVVDSALSAVVPKDKQ